MRKPPNPKWLEKARVALNSHLTFTVSFILLIVAACILRAQAVDPWSAMLMALCVIFGGRPDRLAIKLDAKNGTAEVDYTRDRKGCP